MPFVVMLVNGFSTRMTSNGSPMADRPHESDDDDERWNIGVGRRLAEELQRLGLSQTNVARQFRVTKQLVSHWCHARSGVSAYHFHRLSQIGVDVGFVICNKRSGTAPADSRIKALEAENAKLRAILAEELVQKALKDR
jgi:transcriptional regulator with XRE-family HTH domain